MIISKTVKVKITNRNKTHYKLLNYDVTKKFIDVNVSDLSKGSHVKIKVKCDNCNLEKEMEYRIYLRHEKKLYYCSKCNIISREKTILERYGVKHYTQSKKCKGQIKQTCLKKYGVEHHSQSETIKNNRVKMFLEKHGVKHQMHLKEIKDKIKKTNLEKYGVEYTTQNQEVKQKIVNSWKKKTKKEKDIILQKQKKTIKHLYGVDNIMLSNKIKNFIKSTRKLKITDKLNNILPSNYKLINIDTDFIYTIHCNKCNKNFSTNATLLYHREHVYKVEICTNCNPIDSHQSAKEKQLLDFIKENYSGKIISSDRKILNGKEIDILLTEINIGFEFNGSYWHSEKYRSLKYHIDKVDLAEQKGYKLYHIWEDVWDNQNEMIKEKIKSLILNQI